MSGLKWENADRPNPDPARVLRENIDQQHSDRELETFKRRVKEKYTVKERPAPRVLLAQALRGKIEEKLTIGQRIAVVRQSGKSDAARFIHKTAILVLRHTQDTGDCSSALRLVLAMHPSPRRDKLIKWFASYSPIIVNIKKSKARFCAKDSKTYREFDLVMANRYPFEPCP